MVALPTPDDRYDDADDLYDDRSDVLDEDSANGSMRPPLAVRLKRWAIQLAVAVAIALVAYGAVQAWRIRSAGLRQREIVAALKEKGIVVEERSSPSVAWLRDLFGEEFFTAPTAVAASGSSVDDSAADALAELPSLEKITLAGTQIGDATLRDLARLENLSGLYLADTNVSDDGLAALAGLPRLERLDLTRTKVRGPGLEAVAKLPALRSLWLDGTSLDADAPTRLAASPSLVYLSMNATGARGEALASLKEIKTLETLYLDDNDLSDADVVQLSEARQLTNTLSLYGSPITDASVESLGKFSGLQTLKIEETRITPEGLAMLQRILKKTTILYP